MPRIVRPLADLFPRYWDYHNQVISRITGGNIEQLREILDAPWLQAEENGEQRIMKLMRIANEHGTVLHAAVRTKNAEKVAEVLKPERGGRQALAMKKDQVSGDTPLHTAAKLCRSIDFAVIQVLLATNEGRDARRVRNSMGLRPEEVAINRRNQDAMTVLPAQPDLPAQNPIPIFAADGPAVPPAQPDLPAQNPIPIFAADGPAVPPAVPLAALPDAAIPPAVPLAALPDAAIPPAVPLAALPDAAVPPAFSPIPPPIPFVPLDAEDAVEEYVERFIEICDAAAHPAVTVEALVELLNETWLQQQVNGVRRIQKLMRMSDISGTVLANALRGRSNIGRMMEKLREILRPERGGQAAFRIANTVPQMHWTPLHIACRYIKNVELMRFLLDNGGRQGLLIPADDGDLPIDKIPNTPAFVPIRALFIEAMEQNPPDLGPLPPFRPLEEVEVEGPMEVGGPMPDLAAPAPPDYFEKLAQDSVGLDPNPYPLYLEKVVVGDLPVTSAFYNNETTAYDPLMASDITIVEALADPEKPLVVKTGPQYSLLYNDPVLNGINDGSLVKYGCNRPLGLAVYPTDIYGKNPLVYLTGLSAGNFLVLLDEIKKVLKKDDIRAIELTPTDTEFATVTGFNSVINSVTGKSYSNRNIDLVGADHCQVGSNKKLYTISILNLEKEAEQQGGKTRRRTYRRKQKRRVR